jgi:hypothetical protein
MARRCRGIGAAPREKTYLNSLERPIRRDGIDKARRKASPFVGKNRLEPQMRQRDQRNRGHKGRQQRRPSPLFEHLASDLHHCPCQFHEIAGIADRDSPPALQPFHELMPVASAVNLGIGAAQRRESMCIASRQHLPVQDFHGRETGCEVVKIAFGAPASQARKDMIHAEQQPPFIQVGGKSRQIITAPLQLDMVRSAMS